MNQLYILLLISSAGLLDLCIWGLTGVPFSYLTQALFYTLIGFHAPGWAVLLAYFLSSWHLFFTTGIVGIDLLLVIPLGALVYYFRSIADITRPLLFPLVFSAITLQKILFGVLLLKEPFGFSVLFFAFLSALFMVYLVPGSQGNRLLR